MTDHPRAPATKSLYVQDARTRRRNAAEKRFRAYGLTAIALACAMLAVLVFTIVRDGSSAFRQTYLSIPVALDAQILDPDGNRDPAEMAGVLTLSYGQVLDRALDAAVSGLDLQIDGLESGDVDGLISRDASAQLRNRVLAEPELVGQVVDVNVLVNGRIDGYFKGRVTAETAARDSNVSPNSCCWRRRWPITARLSRGSTGAS